MLKRGDMVLIDGALTAMVRTVRTPAEIRALLPMLSDDGPDDAYCVAIVTTGDGPDQTGPIFQSAEGWSTISGHKITVTLIPEPPEERVN